MGTLLRGNLKSIAWCAIIAAASLAGCGDDGGGSGGVDASGGGGGGDGGGSNVELVDQVGCHMLGDRMYAVPPWEGATRACIVVVGPQLCFVRNERMESCLTDDRVWFEWEPGMFYNVKMNDWSANTSTHGEVTTQTNADSGIIGVPPSTKVTATLTRDADQRNFTVIFTMEDDYVLFEKVEPDGGW